MSARDAIKTTVSYCDTVDGTFTDIGGLVGEIAMPDESAEVKKFRANDETVPSPIIGKPDVADIEHVIKYADYATFAALLALFRTVQFIKYTLDNDDWYVYEAVVSNVSPVTGAEEGACVGKVVFTPIRYVSGQAAA